MFYEHEEIHKFQAKKDITKIENILSVSPPVFIAEGIIQQGAAAQHTQPALLAALQADASNRRQ